MSPKKILCLNSMFTNGGAQEAILRLARQLRSRGHDVDLWFLYGTYPDKRNSEFKILFETSRPGLLAYLMMVFRLLYGMLRLRPYAVISFLPLANVLGQFCAAIVGIRRRVASQRSIGATYGRAMRMLDLLAGTIGIYTRVVCVSSAVKSSFAHYPETYRKRLAVVHNGIEWEESRLSKNQARELLSLPAGAFLVASAGRLERQKNYEFLLNVFERVPDAVLAIAGDGADREKLERQAQSRGLSSRIIFLGNIPRSQIATLLRAADAFALSSIFEGQSNAVLEAMHEGLAILVNDIPENRESLQNQDTGVEVGLLVATDCLDEWLAALQSLRDDRSLRSNLGGMAQKHVMEYFTLTKMIDGFEHQMSETRNG